MNVDKNTEEILSFPFETKKIFIESLFGKVSFTETEEEVDGVIELLALIQGKIQ